MTELFLALIGQLNASVFVLVLILALMFWVIYKIGCWATTFAHFNERVRNVESLSDKVTRISTLVDMIYRNTHPNAPTREASPISLTLVGREISNNIDAQKIMEKYVDSLIVSVEEFQPKNAYDVQQAAFLVARTKLPSMLNEEELIAAKNEAYQRGLLIDDIWSVVGVLLRNRILELKHMPIADVDAHDPEKKL